jgi:pimeloyl-ACP methyl ester carboxylesterase
MDTPHAGSMDTPHAGSMDTPHVGSMDTPRAGSMDTPHAGSIARMEWSTFTGFVHELLTGSPPPEAASALKQYFGTEAHRIQRLASRAHRLRAVLPPLGNVVFVHGTMSADLATVDADGTEELLWMNLPRISRGDLDLLRLDPSGGDPAAGPRLKLRGMNKLAYAPTLLWLQACWNVLPFAYDWRRDLDVAADALAELIHQRFNGEPVHLVAHSMGGMVCRNFIRRHPALRRDMRGDDLRRGGRPVMLGTPSFGSYLATQAMSGQSELVWMLENSDPHHSREELLEIVNSFVSNYQLLPAPDRLAELEQALYARDSWGALPISEAHLARGFEFHHQLATPRTMDPERLLYIAGYGFPTPCGVSITAPGRLEHRFTLRGDGVTTLDLGLLPGVPTWYLLANHFELASNLRVLAAVDNLLLHGRTLLLARRPPSLRAARAPFAAGLRALGAAWIDREIGAIARRASSAEADAAEVYRAERVLLETAMGERRLYRRWYELEHDRMTQWMEHMYDML